ncbi:MAG: 3-oxoacyl-ACP reductase FabG [Gammaproteobacteria bacterium]
MNDKTLIGEIALVTGASRGIGEAIALELARQGARVVGTATSDEGAGRITAQLSSAGGRGVRLDVRDSASIDAALADISGNEGAPLILVNNAGITRDNLLMRMQPAEWDAIIDTNLTAVYRTCRACLRGMIRARRGRIINIGSVIGSMGNAGQANYAAAKAGLIGFSKALAREVGSRNVTVNTVAPGFIETDMTRAMSDEQRETLQKQIPLQRLGDPGDVAATVAFLASPAAAYITGETLHVNGGMYMV